MTKHSFRTTAPVKEQQKPLTIIPLKPLTELLTKAKTVDEQAIVNEPEVRPNLAKAVIQGLENNNYSLFGELFFKNNKKEKSLDKAKNPQEVIEAFTNALIAKDLKALSNLLDDDGAFIVINKTFETVAVMKEQYVNWLRFKLQTESVTQVDMDTCAGCSLGKTVVIYNDGRFPWKVNKIENALKGGLDFIVKNGKITQIKFCYKFKNTINQHGYEKRYDIYKSYIDKGYTKAEADRLSEERWGK